MRRVILVVLSIGAVAAGCRKSSPDRLPPASEWNASPMTDPAAKLQRRPARTGARMPGAPGDPHAGLDMNDPHAGLDMNDPHAGLDMNDPHAGLDMNDPHAGLDMSGSPHASGLDVSKLGLEAPDPDRAIDPNQRVTGAILIDRKARDRARSGTSVFVVVKRAGPDGAPTGPVLAVDKLTWGKDDIPFSLTGANAMLAGTEHSGDVVVMARYDQDSDALTKEPGDITGQVRVQVPANNVMLRLDTVLP
jgi:hypothetical protein